MFSKLAINDRFGQILFIIFEGFRNTFTCCQTYLREVFVKFIKNLCFVCYIFLVNANGIKGNLSLLFCLPLVVICANYNKVASQSTDNISKSNGINFSFYNLVL